MANHIHPPETPSKGIDPTSTRLHLNDGQHCLRCIAHPLLCFCSQLPLLKLTTQVTIFIHQRELCRSSNTARLAALTLEHCELRPHGIRDQPAPTADLLDDAMQTYLLFPGPESRVLNANWVHKDPRPFRLVVIDGSWRQARRMKKRIPIVCDLPTVTLPPGGPSRYEQRQQSHPSNLSTFEAIARALGILEGPEVQKKLETIFDVKVLSDLKMRGKEPSWKQEKGLRG